MFVEYEYQKYLGYNEKTKKYSHQYKIIDTDFTEVAVGVEVGSWVGVVVAVGVIDTYEKRELNVPANLIKAILWHHKTYPYVSINQIIEYNKKHNPKYAKYEKDIEKYLCLL